MFKQHSPRARARDTKNKSSDGELNEVLVEIDTLVRADSAATSTRGRWSLYICLRVGETNLMRFLPAAREGHSTCRKPRARKRRIREKKEERKERSWW